MQYRVFGSTGFRASEIGLGTWQFGGDWGSISEQNAQSILNAAVDNGINFFDTADVYGGGRSESIIGSVFGNRKDLFIATKLGRLEGFPDGYSLELFRRCIENSLKRLGRDAIDLIQLHCIPSKYLENGEAFEWLRILRKEGKIRFFGASVETIDEALTCIKQDDLSSLQIIFNIFRQKPSSFFKEAAAKKVALIIRLPLASGLLSGKFTKDTKFAESDHRNYNRDGNAFNVGETFSGIKFEYGVELSEQIKPLVPQSMNMAQFALRWILDHPEVSTIIPGASRIDQVSKNALASSLPPLGDELHSKLDHFYKTKVEGYIRGKV
ncbi:MAG: aldo/keto reductase [Fibrobacter sp.]|nr:aldo/keto reductase [Fibrobacter sp.]